MLLTKKIEIILNVVNLKKELIGTKARKFYFNNSKKKVLKAKPTIIIFSENYFLKFS